ncbi:MAG TPA: ABC transporter ATP-binding protein [Verrucomicrobiae bacterium]|nr:ABC transporter ATP-binding protein [Verrucomicrobiae bacterium]
MPPLLIELRNVTKRFGQRLAVDQLSLQVERGEIHGLLGHNGAGKSTAIGIMLGQVWPTAGDVIVRGADVIAQRSTALARVGAIFEGPAFYDYLSGRRNLEILSSYSAATPQTRLDEVIGWVGLRGREDSKVSTYSHGMRARLALAQALLPNPELLILDEPSDGLDPEGIHEMRQTILRLHNELGLTILFSSHLLTEVEQICNRITVIRQGQKVFGGKLSDAQIEKGWVRLNVDDFERATQLLQAKGWLDGKVNEPLIVLDPVASTADVVRLLVEAGISVFEIARHEETLEEFYLSLMKGTSRKAP